jgi:endonuclease/exonuclease/phosphatase family metal-dependent hydrolase
MKRQLRITGYNLWHGLNHIHPNLMLPAENPFTRLQRKTALHKGLLELQKTNDSTQNESVERVEFLTFQEANPVRKRCAELSALLNLTGHFAEANVGVRIGQFSYPFFLQEGLITLTSKNLMNVRSERLILSGAIPEFDLNVGGHDIPVSLQLSERRVALLTTAEWNGLTLGVVNLHVHHGPADGKQNKRRLKEFEVLFDLIKEKKAEDCDFLLLTGDFNCEREHDEYSLVEKHGFTEISTTPDGGPLITWDPDHNERCHMTADMAVKGGEESKWDHVQHQFDHIFLRVKKSPGKIPASLSVKASRIFDDARYGTWVSDHYGLCVDLEWSDE